jgi:hypothetical protein
MVGGVLVDGFVIFEASDDVLKALDFAPCLVRVLQIAGAIAHSMGWQGCGTRTVKCVLKLDLQLGQVSNGQVFNSHADNP